MLTLTDAINFLRGLAESTERAQNEAIDEGAAGHAACYAAINAYIVDASESLARAREIANEELGLNTGDDAVS